MVSSMLCLSISPVFSLIYRSLVHAPPLRLPCAVMQPGVHRRAWFAVNDYCSNKGPVWRAKNCTLMEPVMQVPSRGTNLQESFLSTKTAAPADGPPVHVDLCGVDWLKFKGDVLYVLLRAV